MRRDPVQHEKSESPADFRVETLIDPLAETTPRPRGGTSVRTTETHPPSIVDAGPASYASSVTGSSDRHSSTALEIQRAIQTAPRIPATGRLKKASKEPSAADRV